MSFNISYATKIRAQQHALACFPNPARGIIVADSFIPCQADTLEHLVVLAAQRGAEALVYSKPNEGGFPGEEEMRLQQASGLAFGVMGGNLQTMEAPFFWGDSTEIAPVVGRPFVHGVWDCYSLVRDVFRLGKAELSGQGVNWCYDPVMLPDVPRDDGWWDNGQDLYMDWLKPAGFVEISAAAARPGDGFLMKIRSDKLNHAGLLLGENEILHHLPTRLSRREIGGVWFTQIEKWVRFQG
jgi:cell wall-associated NlpC family hydrolase